MIDGEIRIKYELVKSSSFYFIFLGANDEATRLAWPVSLAP